MPPPSKMKFPPPDVQTWHAPFELTRNAFSVGGAHPPNILKKPFPPEGDGRGRKVLQGLLSLLPGGSSAALHNVIIGPSRRAVRSESIIPHYVKAGQMHLYTKRLATLQKMGRAWLIIESYPVNAMT
jgi:hypothetical protein